MKIYYSILLGGILYGPAALLGFNPLWTEGGPMDRTHNSFVDFFFFYVYEIKTTM